MFKFTAYLKKYKKESIVGPIFKFFEAILELLLPTIMALIINNGIAQQDAGYIVKMGGLMVVLAVCGYGCSLICQYSAAVASQGFGTDLRNAFFEHVLNFSHRQLDRFGASTLANRLTNDVNQLQNLAAMMIRMLLRWPFICIGSIVMAFLLDARIALILLASTPVLAGIIYVISKNVSPLYRAHQKRLDALSVLIRENLSGARVIRAFSRAQAEKKRFGGVNDALLKNGLDISRLAAVFNPLTTLVINAVIVLILWAGSIRIETGRVSLGQIVAFIQYAGQILTSLLVLSNLIILITRAMASAARVREVMETAPDMTFPGEGVRPDVSAPAVELRGVSFGYNKTGERALEDITVAIKRGETIGIIGATGSGKSTFINLIARFYDADGGQVLIDGVLAERYPRRELRRKIAVVPQNALVFTGTVADNVRWGNPEADLDQVRRAAEIAGADEFIVNLPQQYDFQVRRGGVNLSGGQRQRLAIARAVAAAPEILILDDATRALDYATDARVRREIRENSGAQTILLVSQRVGVVRDADRIIVFEDGRIAGIGPHGALYESSATYRDICLSQLSEEEARL